MNKKFLIPLLIIFAFLLLTPVFAFAAPIYVCDDDDFCKSQYEGENDHMLCVLDLYMGKKVCKDTTVSKECVDDVMCSSSAGYECDLGAHLCKHKTTGCYQDLDNNITQVYDTAQKKCVNPSAASATDKKYCCVPTNSEGKVVGQCQDITQSTSCDSFVSPTLKYTNKAGACSSIPACSAAQNTVTPEAPPPSAPKETPFVPIEPKLQINIPTLQFSKITKEGQYINVPYLADYIAGVYKYAVSIVSIIAIIMIMVGGLRWLTAGGNASAIGSAKETISGAVIGLILLLGSYTVLYTINPNLVNFKALNIQLIKPDPLDISSLTVEGDTITGQEGGATYSYKDCPITLGATEDLKAKPPGPRAQEFSQKISSILTGTTKEEKIAQISEAAIKCGVTFGNCGSTAKAIYELAGAKLFSNKKFNISDSQREALVKLKCPDHQISCSSASANRQKVFQQLKSELGGGWPESITQKLKPGDVIVMFNANGWDTSGAHSAIFMGWISEGKARVVQGTGGKVAKEGKVCLTSKCSDPNPLIRVWGY